MCSCCYSQKLIADLTFWGMFSGGLLIEFYMKQQRKNSECRKYPKNTFLSTNTP